MKIQLSSAWIESLESAVSGSGQTKRFREIKSRIEAQDMPTSSIEEWRYSKIDDLDLASYPPIGDRGGNVAISSPLMDIIVEANQSALFLDSRNGHLNQQEIELPVGIELTTEDPEDISYDFSGADLFSNLNALLSKPIVLNIDDRYDFARPIILLRYIDAENSSAFPNLCIRLSKGARAKVVEVLISPSNAAVLVVPVTKVFQEESSSLEYLMIQDLGPKAQMVGHQASRLMSDSQFRSMSIVSGGDYARIFTTSTIAGRGADSKLNAAYFGSKDQVLDFRTLQEHSAKNGRSELYFKGAGANEAHLVYSGLIKVDKGATSTDAFQTNRNLVLSEGARADSVPNLDIQENDVRCSHASSVGPIDEEQKYYLESRGISPVLVQRLIVAGFFSEMADRSDVAGVKKVLLELAARKWEELR